MQKSDQEKDTVETILETSESQHSPRRVNTQNNEIKEPTRTLSNESSVTQVAKEIKEEFKDKVADLPSSPTNPSYNSPDKVQDQSTNALKSLGEKMK